MNPSPELPSTDAPVADVVHRNPRATQDDAEQKAGQGTEQWDATSPEGRAGRSLFRRAASALPRDADDGAATGYRPERTLRLRVEFGRQLRRRRTGISLGLLLVLPVVLWASFEVGSDDTGPGQGSFVDLATSSGLNFALFSLFASVSFLFVVVVALFFGDTVAGEASWSSLRYLLAVPIPRARLLRQKALVSGLLSLIAVVVLPASALLIGVLVYGSGPLTTPRGESLPFVDGLTALALVVAYLLVFYLWIAGLALLLSVSTDAPLGAVGGAIIVFIVSQILDQITALGELRSFLPTHHAYAWLDLLSARPDLTDAAQGVFASVSYATVFLLAAGWRFQRKDITS
ncbi:ABC transporter permease [Actinoalloteichus hymeniacidonis]|uniref:ABC transporter permease n=1 Tax=Actinoalloteichus hymeniacidonis TaxID=340345 RepID=A0AAC9HP60_9PSEU|nr:ABC transporter permease [Actinoalloteichus hymeniacidonis]AOS62872.1 ABC transporter permease [Actinoalloteichus hymeniacidonis]MBB5909095.1 ABC-2 type transport system permease protein [Actinoalloteichus hymeniacidonis]